MEKLLVCDICGTSYADTEEKCPTCGYSRAFDEEIISIERSVTPHVKVRGGRYSRKNVLKRLMDKMDQEQAAMLAEPEQPDQIAEPEKVEETAVSDLVAEMVVAVETVPAVPAEKPAAEEVPVIREEKPAAEPAVQEELVQPEPEDQDPEQEQDKQILERVMADLEAEDAEDVEVEEEKANKPSRQNLWLNAALVFASTVFALSAAYLVVQYGVPAIQQVLPAATEAMTELATQLGA